MSKDSKILIAHILESIALIEKYSADKSFDDFINSQQLQDSIAHRLQIIGEAIKNIDDDLKTRHPEIPWRQIAGMRDIIVHEYFGIDNELTWSVITNDLPTLKNQIDKLL
jgi:uncharacterized protein with HEPN domain